LNLVKRGDTFYFRVLNKVLASPVAPLLPFSPSPFPSLSFFLFPSPSPLFPFPPSFFPPPLLFFLFPLLPSPSPPSPPSPLS
ncbi:hypothetical protein ACXWR7_12090, partial [Streptococcus pyogenes]